MVVVFGATMIFMTGLRPCQKNDIHCQEIDEIYVVNFIHIVYLGSNKV